MLGVVAKSLHLKISATTSLVLVIRRNGATYNISSPSYRALLNNFSMLQCMPKPIAARDCFDLEMIFSACSAGCA